MMSTCGSGDGCDCSGEAAVAEVRRVADGTSAHDWKPCGCAGCHWCEIGAAMRHPVMREMLRLATHAAIEMTDLSGPPGGPSR